MTTMEFEISEYILKRIWGSRNGEDWGNVDYGSLEPSEGISIGVAIAYAMAHTGGNDDPMFVTANACLWLGKVCPEMVGARYNDDFTYGDAVAGIVVDWLDDMKRGE